MKLHNHTTILRLLSLSAAILLIAGNSIPVFSQDPSREKELSRKVAITSVFGDVLLSRKDVAEWKPVQAGDLLFEGDSIRTLDASRANLQFPSGSTLMLNNNTSITIQNLVAKGHRADDETDIAMRKGRIKAVIEGLVDTDSQFKVRTPTAVAGVMGTVFYLNVTEASEALIIGSISKGKDKLLLADRILGINKCFAAENGNLITEIFVESGVVNFTNILSNISYNVGQDQGSLADEDGNISEPMYVPPQKQKEWKQGFEPPKKDKAKKDKEGKDKKKDASTTRKKEMSETEVGTSEDEETLGEDPEIEPPADEGGDEDESADERNDNNSPDKTQPQDTGTSVGISVVTDDEELREELLALHNDMVEMTEHIILAQLDARLTEIQDAQAGKVIKDMHGNIVRCENYVLRPTDKKVAIVFLNHRRDGSHKGVSSLSFEVAFNSSLDGVDLKNDIPWSDIMSSDSAITYSEEPAYYPKVSSDPNPSIDRPAMVLTMRNPDGDYFRMYEGFGAPTPSGTVWQQMVAPLTYNTEIRGRDSVESRLTNVSLFSGISDGGSYNVTIDSSTYLRAYVIDDLGAQQSADAYTDGSSEPLRIDSIRGILSPKRAHNLEIEVGATEFDGRTIDVVVAPEVMRPYTDE